MQWARILKKCTKNYDACHSERESLLPFMWQGCTTISNFFPICLVSKIEAKKNGKRDVTWRNQISYPESSGSLVSGNSPGVVKLDKTENAAWFANTYNINDRNVMGNFKSGENSTHHRLPPCLIWNQDGRLHCNDEFTLSHPWYWSNWLQPWGKRLGCLL